MDKKDQVTPEKPQKKPITHSLRTFAVVIIILIVYALGLQVTEVDLETPKEAKRQSQLTNIVRGLANPRLVEYEEERLEIDLPILMPCKEEVEIPAVDKTGRHLEISSDCVALGEEVTVTGQGFKPGETVYLFFVPEAPSIHEQIELRLADAPIEVEDDGTFSYTVEMRSDRPSDEPQLIRAVVKIREGLPSPSDTLKDTIDKIVETVFLALIATTLGTILAIPISFLAARNLMINLVSPFGSIMSSVLLAPFGFALGSTLLSWAKKLVAAVADSVGIAVLVLALILCMAGIWLLWKLLQKPAAGRRANLQQGLISLGVAILAVLALGAFARIGIVVGLALKPALGPFGFLGNAIFIAGDFIEVILPTLGGLVGLFLLSSVAGSIANKTLGTVPKPVARLYTVIVATLAAALLAGLVAASIAWLYEIENRTAFILAPALVVGAMMFVASLFTKTDHPVPIGMIVYNLTRTTLNALRSIEPLIMVVAFAVWVGIGPFAGVMALALHTIASLGKLYSEQVENILTGPVEAITATGANFLQTIVYAVIPQIIPSYTAFTIYRWDINVRMSTIIGFGGGGGIGFLVQQNLNLLKYRDASVQMIAIAIIVATLDYASAKVRERII
jgi:ABC-type phosphate/phosphonate transport system permease subunit